MRTHRKTAPGRRPPLAGRMHPLAAVLSFVTFCVLVTQLCKRCARSQRDAFLDTKVELRRRATYQALPTTIV